MSVSLCKTPYFALISFHEPIQLIAKASGVPTEFTVPSLLAVFTTVDHLFDAVATAPR